MGEVSPNWPAKRTLTLAAAGYLAVLIVATGPALLHPLTLIPGHATDPMVHLWTMRHTQSSLTGERFPYFSDALNYPTGFPLGFNPTMHLQTVGYLAMGVLTDSDILRFNVLWVFGFLSTGIGAYLLAFRTSGSRLAAWLAGLATMLSGPMMLHAQGHIELIQMGAFALFFMAWIDFLDRPTFRSMAFAGAFYLVMVFSCPYMAVLGLAPPAWAFAWTVFRTPRGERTSWLRSRIRWSVTLSGLLIFPLGLAFSGQIWAAASGYSMQRPRTAFDRYGTDPRSYFVPTPDHALGKSLLGSTNALDDGRMVECGSYLGVASIAFIFIAAGSTTVRRSLPRAGLWWSLLALLVILSFGSKLRIGSLSLPMPAGWLWSMFPPMRLLRVPARFNLLVAVVTAVPVAAGAKFLLDQLTRNGRLIATALMSGLIVADLGMAAFPTAKIPAPPDYYRFLVEDERSRSVLDAPLFDSTIGLPQSSLWGYWQSRHGIRSSAGYSAHPNVRFDSSFVHPSPFWEQRYRIGEKRSIGVDPAQLHDEAWLGLNVHNVDHVVLHRDEPFGLPNAMNFQVLESALSEAQVYRDETVTIWARAALSTPEAPTMLRLDGWRIRAEAKSPDEWFAGTSARLALFIPKNTGAISLQGSVMAANVDRTIRLRDAERTLAEWTAPAGKEIRLQTSGLQLHSGIHFLTLDASGSAEELSRRESVPLIRIRGMQFSETAADRKIAGPSGDLRR